jgi:hypothetical protein
MATSQEEWERRYVEHFATRVLAACDGNAASAREWAQSDLGGAGYAELVAGFEEDPEGSAEESLSYYEADEV